MHDETPFESGQERALIIGGRWKRFQPASLKAGLKAKVVGACSARSCPRRPNALCRSKAECFIRSVEELQQLARVRQLSGYLANNPAMRCHFRTVQQDQTGLHSAHPTSVSVPGGPDSGPALERKSPASFFLARHVPALSLSPSASAG